MINAVLKVIQKTPKLNKEALNQYLQFFVPIEENTFYQKIYKLQAGHYLIFDNNTKELKTKKYYKINTTKTIFDESTAIDTIKQNLFDAVESRLIGDSKIASLLSGGVDSSLVSAIFSKLTDSKIDTFSIGYENYKKYDELKYAKLVSKYINSNHHEIILSKKNFIENIDESIEIMGEPHGDSASIPLNILSKQINQNGFKVVLSGEGSDELFLGYNTYQTMLKFYNFQQTLSKEQLDFLYTYTPSLQNNTKESEYFLRIAKKEFLYNSFGETFNNSQKARLLYKPHFFTQKPTQKDFIDAMSLIDMDIWLGNSLLSKVDAITSYNAVETRTPFLDFRLVNNAFAIESNLKLGNTTKYIIKQIADEFLPKEIVHRSKKGFSTPSNEWIHEHYKDEILNLILEVSNATGLFKNDFIKQIYELSIEGKFRQHLWHLFIFAKWFKKIYL
jgi:asparagine synthase (glutamine-hydrolysing)